MLTILPPPRRSMSRAACWAPKSNALLLMFNVQSQWFSSSSIKGRNTPEAALLMYMSKPPEVASISSNMALSFSISPTLALMRCTFDPVSRSISAAVSSAGLRLRKKLMYTSHPSAASRLAMARPIPRLPPVTNAIFPSNRRISSCFIDLLSFLTIIPDSILQVLLRKTAHVPHNVAVRHGKRKIGQIFHPDPAHLWGVGGCRKEIRRRHVKFVHFPVPF